MSTTSEKLSYLNETKGKIKRAINNFGGKLTNDSTFRSYPDELYNAWDNIFNQLPHVEDTSTSPSLSSTLEAPMRNNLKGNTSQTQYTGKNLLPPTIATETKNGITLTNNGDGSYTLTGTYSTSTSFDMALPATLNGTYSFSGNNPTAGKNIQFRILTSGGSPLSTYLNKVNKTDENKTIENGTKQSIRIVGSFTSGFTFKPQLESGSTATSYEPYVGGVATPNPTNPADVNVVSGDNEIEICGKNLLDTTKTAQTYAGVTYKPNADGSITITGTSTAGGTVLIVNQTNPPILEAGTYTRSVKTVGSVVKNSNYVLLMGRNNNGTNVLGDMQINENSTTTKTTTTTDTNTMSQIGIYVSGAGAEFNCTLYIQLEKNSTATDYIPYDKNEYNIDLGNCLPNTYTPVEYIMSSGTQYINTGVIPANNIGVKIKASLESENNSDKVLFGSRAGSNRFWLDFDGTQTPPKFMYGYGSYYGSENYYLNTLYNIEFNYNGSKILKINNNSYNMSGTYDSTDAVPIYLFRANYSSAFSGSFKIYSCKIYNGTTLIRNFIPCIRNNDNEIGLYDLVGNTFYTNSGTGAFTKGNDIENGIELCKIGTYQDYFAKSDGTNLFDKSTALLNKMAQGNGNVIDYTGIFSSDYIKVQPSTSYYVNQYAPVPIEYDKNKNVIGYSSGGNTGSAKTFTTSSDCQYVRIRMFDTTYSMDTALNNAMLSLGSSATPWQPYGVGKWYLHKEIGKLIIDENTSISTPGSDSFKISTTLVENLVRPINQATAVSVFSNYLRPITWAEAWSGKEGFIASNANTNDVRFRITPNMTKAEAQTWLSTHNIILYYQQITPTNTEITDTTLINQLEELYIAKSKENQTNISQVNNDLPFIINATALLDANTYIMQLEAELEASS